MSPDQIQASGCTQYYFPLRQGSGEYFVSIIVSILKAGTYEQIKSTRLKCLLEIQPERKKEKKRKEEEAINTPNLCQKMKGQPIHRKPVEEQSGRMWTDFHSVLYQSQMAPWMLASKGKEVGQPSLPFLHRVNPENN